MNSLNRWIASSIAVLLTAGMTLNFGGCSKESPISPTVDSDQQADFQILAKKAKNGGAEIDKKSKSFVKSGVKNFLFLWDLGYYKGGTIKVGGNGSNFHVFDNSITPPPGTEWGEDLTINMGVKYIAEINELQFTFGPSGTHFSPSAYIKIDYRILDIHNPKLFLIDENDNYIQQRPYYINRKRSFMILRIDHFSSYAVAWAS